MSPSPENECGCCAGIAAETPALLFNRPGLSAIAYRVGAYQSFKRSLQARLCDGRWPVLRGLRTRDDDDFTLALLDAWAVTGDILTFYQERIANESYLRTATERLSILEQSRLLGYQLGPGLAAATHLAFTLEENPGLPKQAARPVTLAVGTKVQSVPGPDEQPQTFETVEAIDARAEWNALRAQLTETQALAWNMTSIWLDGTSLTLTVGDTFLIVADNGLTFEASLRRVTHIEPDIDLRSTRVWLADISTSAGSIAATQPGVYVMRTIASPFGHNAPLQATYANNAYTYDEWDLDGETEGVLGLSSRQDRILVDSWAAVERENNFVPGSRVWTFAKVTGVTHQSMAKYGMAGSVTKLSFDKEVWVTEGADLAALRQITVAAQSEALPLTKTPLFYPVYGEELSFDQLVDGLMPGRPLAVSGTRQRIRVTAVPRTSNRRRLPVDFPGDVPSPPDLPDVPDIELPPILMFDSGGFVLLTVGDILSLLAPPMTIAGSIFSALAPPEFGAVLSDSAPSMLRLQVMDRDGKSGYVNISAGAIELVAPSEKDDAVSEIVFIDEAIGTSIIQDRDRTTVQLTTSLANVYERTTVRINANVAAATHGESVKEPLGSGDAAVPYQAFTLRQPPVTYVGATTPSGSASTLKVYVNEVLWQEVPFFYGHGPTERIYITRQDDGGRTTIRFGDGITGARLPTGQNNVRAEYRKGTGLGGLVRAGQLNLLMSRPLGLKGVVNSEAAQGAEEPESRDDARRNAPLTVLALDRAVSLQDYEDFARTFSGVAKAQAVWVWDGRKRSIFLTVAGPNGEVPDEDGSVMAKLKEALRAYGDPYVPFTVRSYRQAWFELAGIVTVHPDHVTETVMTAVAETLRQRYAFEARSFGQPVALSDVIAAIQAVPGVVAVDLDRFSRTDQSLPAIQARLIADSPAMGADGVVPAAELLLLDPASLTQLKAMP